MEVLGYIAPQTPINEEYVTLVVIQKWLDSGHDVRDIALFWNQGNNGPCIKGINELGVPYDSCEYQATVLAYYHR